MAQNAEISLGKGIHPPDSAAWNVLVGGANLDFVEVRIAHAKPTGRQLVRAYAEGDPDDYIALQWLADGRLEDLAPDEITDLRANDGPHRFIVERSDRTYRLEIDGTRQEWPLKIITGATIKALAGREVAKFDVFLMRKDKPDLELADHDTANLDREGLERFEIRPRQREVVIEVNGNPVRIERGAQTGLQVKQAAITQGVRIELDFVLTLVREQGATRIIGDADVVQIRRGAEFTAIADDDNS